MTDRHKSNYAKRVHAVKPREKRCVVDDDAFSGLTWRVYPTGSSTFYLTHMVHDNRRHTTFGAEFHGRNARHWIPSTWETNAIWRSLLEDDALRFCPLASP